MGARVLGLFEDKITTDHISPAGMIPADSPAGEYLLEHGVDIAHLSTYGSRRGNHEVMVRGGFSNIRLKNLLADGKVGGYTKHLPSGEVLTIYDASVRYLKEAVPLLIIAGKQYGAGSSRDWAAKGPKLLGVKAVVAESFERIHRSNLVAMGVLPLEFMPGESAKTLGLDGHELYSVEGAKALKPALIVLDVNQRIDGRDLLARLKKDPETRDLPVIMLSGVEDQFTRRVCLELGAVDYAVKPIDIALMMKFARLAGSTVTHDRAA